MHGMHARLPKNFVLEERLERYADAIELEPQNYAGCWAQACHDLQGADDTRSFDEVRLDLGCGKGAFVVDCAKQRPNTLYVAAVRGIRSTAHNGGGASQRGGGTRARLFGV